MATVQENIQAAAVDVVLNDALGKKWYESKTFWVNVLAAVALIGQIKFGFIIDPATQSLVLTVVNIALRKITKTPVVW